MAHLPQLGRTDNGPPATDQRPRRIYQIRHDVIANRRRSGEPLPDDETAAVSGVYFLR